MPASRAPALGEPSRGLSRRQPGDGSRWDGALAARRRGGGEASLAGCARQRERPAGILPATAAASCDSRPSRCGDFCYTKRRATTFCSLDSLANTQVFLVVALQCQKPNVMRKTHRDRHAGGYRSLDCLILTILVGPSLGAKSQNLSAQRGNLFVWGVFDRATHAAACSARSSELRLCNCDDLMPLFASHTRIYE